MAKRNLTKSKDLFEKAKNVIPGGVNSPVRAFDPHPFFVESAQGSKLHSTDGEIYVDYCMAYGALLLGHSNSDIRQAVEEQLVNGTLYGAPTELEIKFAEHVSKTVPSLEMLRTVNSGTEATMHALRAARGFTGRKKIVKFEGCFHGAHDSVLVKSGSGATTFGTPTSAGIPEETTRNTIVLPYNNTEMLEETCKREGNEIAAVIIEPVMGNIGLILPEKGYLDALRKLTRKYGVVLIFDEIITGFRLSLGGAQQYYNIKPDMTTLGKVIGGGFPIAVFGGKKEIMQNISPTGKVYQAGTFNGNPVSVKAASTMLRILNEKEKEIYPTLEKNCQKLTKALSDLASEHHLEAQVYSIASMFQIFFTPTPVYDYTSAKHSDIKKFQAYFQELLRQGVFIPPSQFETCFLSTAHNEEDLKYTINAFDKSLKAAANANRNA
ncbi:MAG: glutamate-1-semialdehyde 2,1-aminomutase [Candidatus Bathyarchaeia archaeon]|jgi:glutamate-1-semialdehyde 2,1-aminomutase